MVCLNYFAVGVGRVPSDPARRQVREPDGAGGGGAAALRSSTSRCARGPAASRTPSSTSRRSIASTCRRSARCRRRSKRRTASPAATFIACSITRWAWPTRSAVTRRADAEGDPGGGAAARHRQAGRARAHPQQARQADAGRVRDDEAARRCRRRHPVVDRLSVSGRADRARASRELGWHRLSERTQGRRDSDWRAHPVGRRLLRRADLRSPVSRRR